MDLWGRPLLGTRAPRLQAPEGQLPKPAGGRIGKAPVSFRKEHPLQSRRQRGWGAGEGPGRAASPPGLQPSRN